MNLSGKIVIFGILAVALTAAGTSWWFRYTATHRAATFWGPEASRLIRDAPIVHFVAEPLGLRRDVSAANGLTHLRYALLEDRSFDWQRAAPTTIAAFPMSLEFRRSARRSDPPLVIHFSADHNWVIAHTSDDPSPAPVSCRPIAEGLATIFADFAQLPSAR